jgi:hypothetical protein
METVPRPGTLDDEFRCPNCRVQSLTYAVNQTRYYTVTAIDAHQLSAKYRYTEDGDDARLFCDRCGTYFPVPDAQRCKSWEILLFNRAGKLGRIRRYRAVSRRAEGDHKGDR